MDYKYTHDPELWLQRKDSKDLLNTCHGINKTGRMCRQDLPASSARPLIDAAAILRGHSYHEEELMLLFCFRHKDQAEQLGKSLRAVKKMKRQNSMDSLLQRLGSVRLSNKPKPVPQQRPTGAFHNDEKPRPPHRTSATNKQSSLSSLLCCITGSWQKNEDERLEVRRHRPRPTSNRPTGGHQTFQAPPRTASGQMLSWIPNTLSPQTTSQLLAEMTKPISDKDTDGFIYAFLLTEDKAPAPSISEASSLLSSSQQMDRGAQIVRSDTIKRYARKEGREVNRKLLVKIGRATNVHQRITQWSQQCGQNITLIRIYPHRKSSSTAKTVPYVHRVERLIHIELAGKQARSGPCHVCGQQHREWFEIEASEGGLRELDDSIKRWVGWAEKKADGQQVLQ